MQVYIGLVGPIGTLIIYNLHPGLLTSGGNEHMQPIDGISGRKADTHSDFWDRYVAHMQAQGTKPTVVRWYVIRAEQYLRTMSHQRLADHTPQDVTTYLEVLGRRQSMTDWQYRQTVEAIQQLLLLAEIAWAHQFD